MDVSKTEKREIIDKENADLFILNAPRFSNYINGRWKERALVLSESFIDRNPATGEVLGIFPNSLIHDINLAVITAKCAFDDWRQISRIERSEYLFKLAKILEAKKEELEILVTKDCGKSINEGAADIVETIHMIQYAVGEAGMPCGAVLASEIAEKTAYMMTKPIGVMAVITPWNFPAAIPLWLIAPSLLEGNTVVWKPSEETPLVANRLMELFKEADFPPGVINLTQGGKDTGKNLVMHPGIDRVLFTGSSDAADWIVKQQAQRYPHRLPPVCEKGGKNALIALDDADMDLAVNASILSAFKTSGQRCVSAGRIIVHENIIDEFCERFINIAKRVKASNPLNPTVFMGPLINKAGFEKVQRFNDEIRNSEKGGGNSKILYDGGFVVQKKLYGNGETFFADPFVYRIKTWWMRNSRILSLREEVFGPHVAIIPCKDIDDAIRIYNDTDYGLSCAVITEDYRKFNYCFRNCDAGLFYHNLPTIGAESRIKMPFGGVKRSGTGMPSAGYLIDAVTHKVAVTINNSKKIKLAQGLSAKV